MKKILCLLFCLGYLFAYAQQHGVYEYDTVDIRLVSLDKKCDSVRTMQGSIMVAAIDKSFKKVSMVNIKAYSRGQMVMDAETDLNGFCNFMVSDPARIDSITGYKGGISFKCVMAGSSGSGKNYILQAGHYTETGDKKK